MCLTQSDTLGGYTPGKEPFKLHVYGPQVLPLHLLTAIRIKPSECMRLNLRHTVA